MLPQYYQCSPNIVRSLADHYVGQAFPILGRLFQHWTDIINVGPTLEKLLNYWVSIVPTLERYWIQHLVSIVNVGMNHVGTTLSMLEFTMLEQQYQF